VFHYWPERKKRRASLEDRWFDGDGISTECGIKGGRGKGNAKNPFPHSPSP